MLAAQKSGSESFRPWLSNEIEALEEAGVPVFADEEAAADHLRSLFGRFVNETGGGFELSVLGDGRSLRLSGTAVIHGVPVLMRSDWLFSSISVPAEERLMRGLPVIAVRPSADVPPDAAGVSWDWNLDNAMVGLSLEDACRHLHETCVRPSDVQQEHQVKWFTALGCAARLTANLTTGGMDGRRLSALIVKAVEILERRLDIATACAMQSVDKTAGLRRI